MTLEKYAYAVLIIGVARPVLQVLKVPPTMLSAGEKKKRGGGQELVSPPGSTEKHLDSTKTFGKTK